MSTHQLTIVSQAVLDKILTNQYTLGLEDVFWGDQNLIPKFPAVCVEPGELTRTIDGTRRAQNDFEVFLMVYVSKIGDVQVTSKKVLEVAEAISDVLESDVQMNNTVIWGHVSNVTPGIVQKGNTLLRAARLRWVAMTRNTIGVN